MNAEQLKAAGFSDQEVGDYTKLQGAGFSDAEIEQHYKVKVSPPVATSPSLFQRGINTIKNIPSDISSNIDALLSIGKNPLQAGSALAGLISGGERTALRELSPMSKSSFVRNMPIKPEEEQFRKMVEPYVAGFNKPQDIPGMVGKFIEERPVTAALTAAPFVGPEVKEALSALKGTVRPFKQIVQEGIQKGIRLPFKNQGNWPQVEKHLGNYESGIKQIIENKNNLVFEHPSGETIKGKLPEGKTALGDFSNATRQTMKNTYEKYHSKGLVTEEKISPAPIADELEKTLANAPAVVLNHPETVKYIQEVADRYRNYRPMSIPEIEDVLADLNKSLKPFYGSKPGWDEASKQTVNALIANRLRGMADDAVTRATGPGYQQFRNEWGSLKSIESEVTHRYDVDARKNIKGLVDFSSLWSSTHLIEGLLTLNPVSLGKYAAIEATKRYIKHTNDPNNIISKMFKEAEKAYNTQPQSTPWAPIKKQKQIGTSLPEFLYKGGPKDFTVPFMARPEEVPIPRSGPPSVPFIPRQTWEPFTEKLPTPSVPYKAPTRFVVGPRGELVPYRTAEERMILLDAFRKRSVSEMMKGE